MELIKEFFISTVSSFFTFMFLNFRDVIKIFSKFKISKKEAFKIKIIRVVILEEFLDSILESVFVGFICLGIITMFMINTKLLIIILIFMIIRF